MLRIFEGHAQIVHLLIEPTRLAPRGIDFELKTGLQVAIGKRVGDVGRRLRAVAGKLHVDHVAVARRPHFEMLEELIRPPIANGTDVRGRLCVAKLLDEFRIARQFHPIDHLQGNVVTRDHVRLSRQVCRGQLRRHGVLRRERIAAAYVDDDRRLRFIFLRQQQARRDGEPPIRPSKCRGRSTCVPRESESIVRSA